MSPLPRGDHPWRQRRPLARVAPPAARVGRRAVDQQRRGRHQLRDARAEPADARVRPVPLAWRRAGGAAGACGRAGHHPRRRRTAADAGDDRHRGRRGRHRHRGHHGRREHRGEHGQPRHPARGRLLGSGPDPARAARPQPEHRGELPVRARHRSVGRGSRHAPMRGARARDRWRDAGRLAPRSLARAHQPAAHLPPPGSGGPGAWRRAALAPAGAVSRGDRRHGGE